MSRRVFSFDRLSRQPAPANARETAAAVLTTDELERGLQALQQSETDSSDFWTLNGPAFRETIRLAIRETSGALLHHEMSAALRAELECQLVWLENYLSPNPQKLN